MSEQAAALPDASAGQGPVSLRRNGGFRMLWVGQLLSDTGSEMGLAWAATEGRTWAAGLAGPALGGLLFGAGRAVPFLADAVSYAVSFLTVSRIHGRFRPERAPERKALRHEVLDGLRLVWNIPLLRAVAVLGPLVNFAFNGVLFAITVGLRQHGTSAVVIGLVQGGIMAGGALGAPVAPLLQRRLRPRAMFLAMNLAGTLLLVTAAVLIPSPLVALPVAVLVLLAPAGNSGLLASAQRQTPEQMRGRVSSTVTMTAMSLAALAPLLAGLLIEHVSASWAIGAFAAADAVAAVLTLAMPGLRDADTRPTSSG